VVLDISMPKLNGFKAASIAWQRSFGRLH